MHELPHRFAVAVWLPSGLLTVLLLPVLAAGAVFLREAWQDARWNGMLAVRLEL